MASDINPQNNIGIHPDPLTAHNFSILPLGDIKPLGWLRMQLQTQAEGLTGHIDTFWPDLGPDSGWLGGNGESWERGPYYLDGLVPLAYLLNDPRLIVKAQKWMDWILDHSSENGWLGPLQDPHETYHPPFDPWPQSVLMKALAQYHEATGDERVIPAMQRIFIFLDQHLQDHPLSTWSEYRWGEIVFSILWLFEHVPDANLLKLANKIRRQGFDWTSFFTTFPFKEKIKKGKEGYDFRTHGVNVAMGLKAPGLWYSISPTEIEKKSILAGISNLNRYHGQITGVFSSDGHLAGIHPWQGTELCTVVELMFSLEVLISIFGEASWADQLEKIAYNALPAAFSPDMWTHQYDQQVNQVQCTIAQRDWTTNWDDSNIFGLEPSFGCCTANMHQGWPKYVRSLWMGTPNQGLAVIAYAPSRVTFQTSDDNRVIITEETDYPFDNRILFKVHSSEPVSFPFQFRVPSWCSGATLQTSDSTIRIEKPDEFYKLTREWKPGEEAELELKMPLEILNAPSGGVYVQKGPLLYSLKIEEEWRPLQTSPPLAERNWAERVGPDWVQHHADPPHRYYEVLPRSPWNVGLVKGNNPIERDQKSLGDQPFSPDGTPLELQVKGREIPDWKIVNNSAGPLPTGLVPSDEPIQDLTLIPYGCTNLRVTIFPEVL